MNIVQYLWYFYESTQGKIPNIYNFDIWTVIQLFFKELQFTIAVIVSLQLLPRLGFSTEIESNIENSLVVAIGEGLGEWKK